MVADADSSFLTSTQHSKPAADGSIAHAQCSPKPFLQPSATGAQVHQQPLQRQQCYMQGVAAAASCTAAQALPATTAAAADVATCHVSITSAGIGTSTKPSSEPTQPVHPPEYRQPHAVAATAAPMRCCKDTHPLQDSAAHSSCQLMQHPWGLDLSKTPPTTSALTAAQKAAAAAAAACRLHQCDSGSSGGNDGPMLWQQGTGCGQVGSYSFHTPFALRFGLPRGVAGPAAHISHNPGASIGTQQLGSTAWDDTLGAASFDSSGPQQQGLAGQQGFEEQLLVSAKPSIVKPEAAPDSNGWLDPMFMAHLAPKPSAAVHLGCTLSLSALATSAAGTAQFNSLSPNLRLQQTANKPAPATKAAKGHDVASRSDSGLLYCTSGLGIAESDLEDTAAAAAGNMSNQAQTWAGYMQAQRLSSPRGSAAAMLLTQANSAHCSMFATAAAAAAAQPATGQVQVAATADTYAHAFAGNASASESPGGALAGCSECMGLQAFAQHSAACTRHAQLNDIVDRSLGHGGLLTGSLQARRKAAVAAMTGSHAVVFTKRFEVAGSEKQHERHAHSTCSNDADAMAAAIGTAGTCSNAAAFAGNTAVKSASQPFAADGVAAFAAAAIAAANGCSSWPGASQLPLLADNTGIFGTEAGHHTNSNQQPTDLLAALSTHLREGRTPAHVAASHCIGSTAAAAVPCCAAAAAGMPPPLDTPPNQLAADAAGDTYMQAQANQPQHGNYKLHPCDSDTACDSMDHDQQEQPSQDCAQVSKQGLKRQASRQLQHGSGSNHGSRHLKRQKYRASNLQPKQNLQQRPQQRQRGPLPASQGADIHQPGPLSPNRPLPSREARQKYKLDPLLLQEQRRHLQLHAPSPQLLPTNSPAAKAAAASGFGGFASPGVISPPFNYTSSLRPDSCYSRSQTPDCELVPFAIAIDYDPQISSQDQQKQVQANRSRGKTQAADLGVSTTVSAKNPADILAAPTGPLPANRTHSSSRGSGQGRSSGTSSKARRRSSGHQAFLQRLTEQQQQLSADIEHAAIACVQQTAAVCRSPPARTGAQGTATQAQGAIAAAAVAATAANAAVLTSRVADMAAAGMAKEQAAACGRAVPIGLASVSAAVAVHKGLASGLAADAGVLAAVAQGVAAAGAQQVAALTAPHSAATATVPVSTQQLADKSGMLASVEDVISVSHGAAIVVPQQPANAAQTASIAVGAAVVGPKSAHTDATAAAQPIKKCKLSSHSLAPIAAATMKPRNASGAALAATSQDLLTPSTANAEMIAAAASTGGYAAIPGSQQPPDAAAGAAKKQKAALTSAAGQQGKQAAAGTGKQPLKPVKKNLTKSGNTKPMKQKAVLPAMAVGWTKAIAEAAPAKASHAGAATTVAQAAAAAATAELPSGGTGIMATVLSKADAAKKAAARDKPANPAQPTSAAVDTKAALPVAATASALQSAGAASGPFRQGLPGFDPFRAATLHWRRSVNKQHMNKQLAAGPVPSQQQQQLQQVVPMPPQLQQQVVGQQQKTQPQAVESHGKHQAQPDDKFTDSIMYVNQPKAPSHDSNSHLQATTIGVDKGGEAIQSDAAAPAGVAGTQDRCHVTDGLSVLATAAAAVASVYERVSKGVKEMGVPQAQEAVESSSGHITDTAPATTGTTGTTANAPTAAAATGAAATGAAAAAGAKPAEQKHTGGIQQAFAPAPGITKSVASAAACIAQLSRGQVNSANDKDPSSAVARDNTAAAAGSCGDSPAAGNEPAANKAATDNLKPDDSDAAGPKATVNISGSASHSTAITQAAKKVLKSGAAGVTGISKGITAAAAAAAASAKGNASGKPSMPGAARRRKPSKPHKAGLPGPAVVDDSDINEQQSSAAAAAANGLASGTGHAAGAGNICSAAVAAAAPNAATKAAAVAVPNNAATGEAANKPCKAPKAPAARPASAIPSAALAKSAASRQEAPSTKPAAQTHNAADVALTSAAAAARTAAGGATQLPRRDKPVNVGAGSVSHAQNTTGHWGVRDRRDKYEAFVATNDFRYLYVGQLKTVDDAIAARDAAMVAIYGVDGAVALGVPPVNAAGLTADQVSTAAAKLRKKDNVLAVMKKHGTA